MRGVAVSDAPEGTKAWRKGWRKRWREGSSFRSLSLPAKMIVIWVEENANDEGRVVTTIRHLAKMISGGHGKQKVPRMTLWRALQEAVDAGLLVTEAGQQAGQQEVQPPTIITRCNFKDYQDSVEEVGTASGTALVTQAGRSSRRRQRKQKEDPQLVALVDALKATYREVKGEDMDWRGASYGDLAGIRAILSDDGEVQRRWRIFVAYKKYWPTKSMHHFRKAFQNPAISEGKSSSLTLLPGIPEFG
jgi:hypothetical protein